MPFCPCWLLGEWKRSCTLNIPIPQWKKVTQCDRILSAAGLCPSCKHSSAPLRTEIVPPVTFYGRWRDHMVLDLLPSCGGVAPASSKAPPTPQILECSLTTVGWGRKQEEQELESSGLGIKAGRSPTSYCLCKMDSTWTIWKIWLQIWVLGDRNGKHGAT